MRAAHACATFEADRPLGRRRQARSDVKAVGVDIGGTFTDLMLYDSESGEVHVHKVPSTPEALDEAMVKGLTEDAVKRLASLKTQIDQQFERVDTRLNTLDTRLDRVEAMLAQILARLPEKS